ncbi:hydrogen gas-evolving membrane-bound hydrogenase subunit E [Quadrisphaera sp. KR29]|uniref:hydrogen gas-evolving membrane-bound hydrogenase subunit E n=1 Tax=Quadrisphaera sp. KR29 TaxID=3461391 RepID=UPI0040444E0A
MIMGVALALLALLAASAPLLARPLGRQVCYVLSAGFLLSAGLLVSAAPAVLGGRPLEASVPWIPSLGVSAALRMDALSLVFALVALVVGALVMAYCARYLDDGGARGPVPPLLAVFAAAMVGLVLADDLVLLYLFWELTTLCSFALLSTAGQKAVGPGRRALVVTVAGGLALLVAVVLLALAGGTTRISVLLAEPDVVLSSPYAWPVALCVLFAAMTKSAQLPVQFWLPGAMVAMTPVSAYLHAATMVKAGIYLLVRASTLYAEVTPWQVALVGVGMATALVGAVMALREHDLKAILAHSTVSQLGLLVAAIGVGTPLALGAALLHTMAHALFKATLFMLVGIIDKETGSRDIRDLSGLRRAMPWTAAATALAALSMAGVPPALGFVSKEYLYQGFVAAPGPVWVAPLAAGCAVTASALTFAYSMRIVWGAFGGPDHPDLYEPAKSFLAPAAVAAGAGLLLGPAVSLFDPLVVAATSAALPGGEPPRIYFWHGLSTEVVLSLVTIAVGSVLFWQRERVDAVLLRLRLPDAGALFDAGHARLISLGGRVGAETRSAVLATHLARPLAVVAVVGVVGAVALGGALPERTATAVPGELLVAAVLVVVLAGALVTSSAIVLVALVGLVGLVVAVRIVLVGAADVSLTLLLVEALTAVVVVLALREGSLRLPPAGGRGAVGAAVLAVGTGVAAGLGTWALTGRRELSDLGAYVLENSEELTGGTNVVNTVLVDFRGLDTLLESVLVGVVAVGLGVLAERARPAATLPVDVVLRVAARALAPVMVVVSVVLLWRGHDEPGGGFIGGLVAGAAVVLVHLGTTASGRSRWTRLTSSRVLAAGGALLATGTGLVPLLWGGALLQPFTVPGLYSLGIGSALLFDLGVYALVISLVVACVRDLGAAPAPLAGRVPEEVRAR